MSHVKHEIRVSATERWHVVLPDGTDEIPADHPLRTHAGRLAAYRASHVETVQGAADWIKYIPTRIPDVATEQADLAALVEDDETGMLDLAAIAAKQAALDFEAAQLPHDLEHGAPALAARAQAVIDALDAGAYTMWVIDEYGEREVDENGKAI